MKGTRKGRPLKQSTPGRRTQLSMLVTAEMKQRIADRALASGRTLSQEGELMLEQAMQRCAAMRWSAIFSAPRDGSKIIAISSDFSLIEILYWDGERGSWIDQENGEAGTNLGLYAGWIPAPEGTPDCAIVNSPCPI